MPAHAVKSDADLLDLLRIAGSMGVNDLAVATNVTATAVRQRLTRLIGRRLIQREAVRSGRGRPHHLYRLTEKGLQQTGSNFTDLARAMWREIGRIEDAQLRQQILRRVVKALAEQYAQQITGTTTAERMRSLAALFSEWRIPVSLDEDTPAPSLTAHACPYPRLAENDRNVCLMEQMLFSELLGSDVSLTSCRLDGATNCQFHAQQRASILTGLHVPLSQTSRSETV